MDKLEIDEVDSNYSKALGALEATNIEIGEVKECILDKVSKTKATKVSVGKFSCGHKCGKERCLAMKLLIEVKFMEVKE